MAGISNIAGMALSYRSMRCLISFATFWAMMMIATSSRWEKLAKVDSISFVVVSAMRCDQTQIFFFGGGGMKLGLTFLAMRSRLLVCLLVSTMRKFVFCR